jgi:hypothetical protein
MKRKQQQPGLDEISVSAALRRAAKKAIEYARLTGTPAYIWENGRIVDAAKRPARPKKSRQQKTK